MMARRGPERLPNPAEEKEPFYMRWPAIVIALLVIWPVGLILLITKIIGVVPRFLEEKTDNYPYLDEIIRTEELSDRKDKMIALSDMFIAVPGGIGTLDELFSILAMKASDRLHGKIVIYNVNGFFDGLLDCLKQMERGGFLYSRLEDLFRVETPESLGL